MEQELYETELIDGIIHVKKYLPQPTSDEVIETDPQPPS